MREPKRPLDLVAANRDGQQLFLADMFGERRTRADDKPGTTCADAVAVRDRANPSGRLPNSTPVDEQLTLFTIRHDLAAVGRPGLHLRADPDESAPLEAIARDLAAAQKWSTRQLESAIIGIRIVLGMQPDGRAPVRASEVECLTDINLPVWTVLEVLQLAGVLIDDRTPALDTHFYNRIQALPHPMTEELGLWFEVMKNGSRTPPRRRSRSPRTIILHLGWALPTLHAWASAGHTSLREITKEHILDALPASGNPRSTTGQGLKSIFRLLKARRVLFTDPTARVKTGEHETRQPLPVDVDLVSAALHSKDPTRAFLVALIAFHGLRPGHLQRLRITDIRDGRLSVDGRSFPLADPVRERLDTYLTHRNGRWPETSNNHLFVHYRTVHHDTAVGLNWIRLVVGDGLTPRAVREDRILNEVNATGGDARALADLFGLSIKASTRYVATLEHPDLAAGSRTDA